MVVGPSFCYSMTLYNTIFIIFLMKSLKWMVLWLGPKQKPSATSGRCMIPLTGFYVDKLLSRSLCGVHLCKLKLCVVTVKYCRQACKTAPQCQIKIQAGKWTLSSCWQGSGIYSFTLENNPLVRLNAAIQQQEKLWHMLQLAAADRK